MQPNAPTVQEALNYVFSTLLKEKINVVGAGRTDAGVHARNYVASFECTESVPDIKKLIYKSNVFIHPDIVIHDIVPVDSNLHSRFSAISRSYLYQVHTKKDPFITDFSTFIPYKLDVEKMNLAAEKLLLFEDFTSFSKLHTDVKTNNCKISNALWIKQDHRLLFNISADRFLRNMVRAIVGTLLSVGSNKMSVEGFVKVIESKDRSKAGTSAPAHGLSLISIEYPEKIFM